MHKIRALSRVAISSVAAAAMLMTVAPAAQAAEAHEANVTVLPFASYQDMVFDNSHGHLFVSGGDVVVVTDGDGRVVRTIDGAKGASGMALSADGTKLYVGLSGANAIAVVDTVKLKEVQRYKVGSTYCPRDVAVAQGKIWFSHQCGGFDTYAGFSSIEPVAQPVVRRWAGGTPYAPRIVASQQWPDVLLASNSQREPLSLYDISSGEAVHMQTAYQAPYRVEDLALTADSQRVVLAAGNTDHPVHRTWGLQPLHTYTTGPHPNAVAVGARDRVAAGVDGAPTSPLDIYVYEDGATSPSWTYDLGGRAGSQNPDRLAPRGLAWGTDNSRLYAVSVDSLGANPVLHTLVPSTFSWTELSLNYLGPWDVPIGDATGQQVQLGGQLVATTGVEPGEQTIHITRQDALGDEQLPDMRSSADGTYEFFDVLRAPGAVTYTARFEGTADLGASQQSLSFDLSSP